MPRVLVLQHQDDAPPALLADWAQERGVVLDVVRPDRERPADPGGADAVVVLGADASAARRSASWIDDEVAWLRAATTRGLPVLGICFGGQVLAEALGGSVERASRPEIGWFALPEARAPVPAGPWFAWHEDAFTPPPGAEVLARTEVAVQAFAAGPHLGVQFHPEVTPAIAESWASTYGARDLARVGLDAGALRAQGERHGAAAALAARRLFDAWAARAGL